MIVFVKCTFAKTDRLHKYNDNTVSNKIENPRKLGVLINSMMSAYSNSSAFALVLAHTALANSLSTSTS